MCIRDRCRDTAVTGLVNALLERHKETNVDDDSASFSFRAPEDAVSWPLDRNNLIYILRFLKWKTINQAWERGISVPSHMKQYQQQENVWWAPTCKLPMSRRGVWLSEGDGLLAWKKHARSLLDMSAWKNTATETEHLKMTDIFNVTGRTLAGQSFEQLVACLGIWLNWHHNGCIVCPMFEFGVAIKSSCWFD